MFALLLTWLVRMRWWTSFFRSSHIRIYSYRLVLDIVGCASVVTCIGLCMGMHGSAAREGRVFSRMAHVGAYVREGIL